MDVLQKRFMDNRKLIPFEENKRFIFAILKIILLTNFPAVVMLFAVPKIALGWMTGSFASAVNFWFMALKVMQMSPNNNSKNRVLNSASKIFMLRFGLLTVWALFVMLVIKPELIVFCLGLLATQFAIVVHHVYLMLTQGPLKKYFSEDESNEKADIKEQEDEKKEKT